jgi:hypothetical protein
LRPKFVGSIDESERGRLENPGKIFLEVDKFC